MLSNVKSRNILFFVSFISAGLIVMLISSASMSEPDTFWHIKNGQLILQTHGILTHDSYSWVTGVDGKPLKVTTQEWLFDLIAYTLVSIFSVKYIPAITGIAAMVNFGLMYIYIARKTSKRYLALGFAFLVSMTVFQNFSYRPQFISVPLMVLYALLLDDSKYVLAAVVMVLGINIHGGMLPIFLAITGYLLIRNGRLKLLPLFILLTFLNPSYLSLFTYVVRIFLSSGKLYAVEWNPTQLITLKPLVVEVLALMMVSSMREWKPLDRLVITVFFVMALKAVRYIPIFEIILVIVYSGYVDSDFERAKSDLADGISAITAKLSTAGIRIHNVVTSISRSIPTALTASAALAVGLLLSLVILGRDANLEYTQRNTEITPIGAVDFIKSNNLENVMNYYNCGGYLIYSGVKVFIDGRADLYTANLNKGVTTLDDSQSVTSGDTELKLMNEYHSKYTLVHVNSALYEMLVHDARFTSIFNDGVTAIFSTN